MNVSLKRIHVVNNINTNFLFSCKNMLIKMAVLLACLTHISPVQAGVNYTAGTGKASYGKSSSYGTSTNLSEIAQKELARRQALIEEAKANIAEGDLLLAQMNFEEAISNYRASYDILPEAPMTELVRHEALAKWSDASVVYAHKLAEGGDYTKSKEFLSKVIEDNPSHEKAKTLLRRVNDPGWFNPAITPEHVDNVAKVKELLHLASGQFDTGQYDAAKLSYNGVLRIDQYNSAAQRGLEKIESELINTYYSAGRLHMRAKAIAQIDAGWVPNVPTLNLEGKTGSELGALDIDDTGASLAQKLKQIVIPRTDFVESSLQEAVDFLRLKAKEVDVREPDPDKKGVNIVLEGDVSEALINLRLGAVPLAEVLNYIARITESQIKVEQYAIKLIPASADSETLLQRNYRVPPGFLSAGAGDANENDDPFADEPAGGIKLQRVTAKEKLEKSGVKFPDGASATYDESSSILYVRNTQPELDYIDAIVGESINQEELQIFITTKFVEVTQTNLEEFGFDWQLGAFNVGGDQLFGSGGVIGNSAAGPQGAAEQARFPFNAPNGTSVGTNPLTRGLRFGDTGITPNRVDQILQGAVTGNSLLSPGIFGLAGVFTDPQFQVLVRALDQKKGVDLLTAPSILTKSGQTARVEIVREFIYPIEFEPPELPDRVVVNGGNTVPITPTTPTAFETRKVGIGMEVDAGLGGDGYTVELSLAPEVVQFDGFINYGTPINASVSTAGGNPVAVQVTPNQILQPVFSTRRVTTALTIWDGQTVGIGGLMREDVQSIEDKVPVLGDLPVIGRLWQLESEEHVKSNLIIFVTARIVDPSGVPVHSYEELLQGKNTGGGS